MAALADVPRTELPDRPLLQQELTAAAWSFRFDIEREAAQRFDSFAERMAAFGVPQTLIGMARSSASDERRHAQHCAGLAARFGAPVDEGNPVVLQAIAPEGLTPRQALLYEVVAACCVTETVSTSVLSLLVRATNPGALHDILRELLRDEVKHSQLGWGYLGFERDRMDVRFLGELIPFMLAGAESEEIFLSAPPEREDLELLQDGVLPISLKRRLFEEVLMRVTFPGLDAFGIDTTPSRRWLAGKLAFAAGR